MILPNDFDFTQSNLQDYVDCPYRFYLRYILHTKWPALIVDDASDFEQQGQIGARFHRLIQQYLLGVPADRIADLAEADPSPEIARWWEGFITHVPPWLNGQTFVEASLTTTLMGYRLLAKYDLILLEDQGKLTIFDWKTSQKRPRKEWLLDKIQTRLYRFILAQAGSVWTKDNQVQPGKITMQYWFAAHPERPIVLPYDQNTFEKDRQYFTGLISEIQAKDAKAFYRTEDQKHCRFCVYRSHCNRGIQAGDLESFEDFELEPEIPELDVDFEEVPEIEF